ncbi:MAG TPA: SDR family oxidoreductase [Vicinamibacterales bacterium]|nr:SDR family oxidoreductase [Vicinamibacterales bacterium]
MTESPSPVAIVTGARKGIGRFLAERLLSQGYTVVAASRHPCEWAADGLVDLPSDVTNEQAVRALVKEVVARTGRVDVLLNNAGAASMNHALLTPLDTFNRLVQTNLIGTWLMSREVIKVMQRRKFGRIVNVSSIAVPFRLEGQAAYVASKAAVEALSQVMAREVAELGITVNVIGATPVATDMTRGIPAETMDRLVARLPIRRLGTLEDVAGVLDFFLAPGNGAVTGQIVYLGGVPNI